MPVSTRVFRAAFAAVLVVAALVAVAPGAGAQSDAVQWTSASGGNDHWYRLSSRPVDGLDDAIGLAAESSGYVVSILSEGEKDFLVDTFGDTTQYLIGYTDRDAEGTWVWVSGEPSGYEFWASGEPNNCGSLPDGSPGCADEAVAVMNWQHAPLPAPQEPPGAWNDLPGFGGHAIFEYDTEPPPLPPPPASPSLTPMPDILLVDGQPIALTGSGWPAGQTLFVTECRLDLPLGLNTCDSATQQTYTVEPTGTLPAGSTYTVAQSIVTGSGPVDCAADPVGGCGLVGVVWPGDPGVGDPAAIDFPNNNRIHFLGPWSITVTPETGLADGQTVTVDGVNWPAGIGVSFEQCKPTFAGDYAHLDDDCMWLPDGAGTIVGPDGTFSVPIPVHQVITTGAGLPFDCAPDGCVIHANSQFGPLVNAVSSIIEFSVAPDTPPSKAACKQGGWKSYTDDEGTPFTNQGDCVSYVATGGKNPAG